MKLHFSKMPISILCECFSISRQAYYQHARTESKSDLEKKLILQEVRLIRQKHPNMGTRKLYLKLQVFLQKNGIKFGRDALFNLLSEHNLLIKKRKRYIVTTNSRHRFKKYPNLIINFVPSAYNMLWVSDITYWKICDELTLFISFITDAYSHKIVGYQVAETLEAIESIKALRRAIKKNACSGFNGTRNLIHHSDRGTQYCSADYIKVLKKNDIKISMTQNGDPLENAIAERVNGIIKEEYLYHYKVKNIKEAKRLLDSVVKLYNDDRPHASIGYLTPNEVHNASKNIEFEKLWKNYYKKNANFVNQSTN